MGPGNGGWGGPRYEYEKVQKPKNIKDVPRYLSELFGGFFYRLGYIFVIVWRASPLILFTMVFISIFDGIMPVIGSMISASVLDELHLVIQERILSEEAGIPFTASFWGSAVLSMLIVLFVYRICNRVVTRISNSIIKIAGEKVTNQVKVQIMEKARTIDLASFDMPAFYEKLENANREAGHRPIQTLQSTFSIISTIIQLISYILILARIPNMWWMPLGVVLISVPSAIVSFVYRRKHFQYVRWRSKDRRQLSYFSGLLVNKDLVKEIRIFDLADTFIDRYNRVFKKYYAGLRKLIIAESAWLIGIAVVSAVVNCIFYAVIAFGVFVGRFTIGNYSLYTGALNSIANCVTSFINTSASVYEGTLFIDNLISFMKEKPSIVPIAEPPKKVDKNAPHTIVFDNVSFSYPGTDRKVIKNLSTTFRPGETVVLVGLNGAGKTTLIKLLTRLYDPTEGRILLDGKDLREYDVRELYDLFGIIFQDFGKYAVTAAENISFGDIHKTEDREKVEGCARQANAEDYISKLPDGYDTPLTRIFEKEGIELSGGQWQKLAIARAFYRDSEIMILDEPTASLDPMAEQEIFNQFDTLREGKTTIFVSHRLSSAVIATKILVLEYGELIEEGNHHDLMAKRGKYYDLFTTQAKRYLEGGRDVDEEDRPHRRPPRHHSDDGEERPRRRPSFEE